MTVEQLSIFEGERRRDAALERVEAAAEPEWKTAARRAVRVLADVRDEFTTDAVWGMLEIEGVEMPREPRALGAIMREAAKRGLIVGTDRTVKSVRPECHRRDIRVWRSTTRKEHGR